MPRLSTNNKHSIVALIAVPVMMAWPGCARITHVPQCPVQGSVGEQITITATVRDPGGVPRYLWEVIPDNAGTFGDERAVSTTFTPSTSGRITLQLSAADGLFMYVNHCIVQVGDGGVNGVAVDLLVNPEEAVIGNSVLLTCTSTGADPAATLTVTQTVGDPVALTDILPGIVAFDAEEVGTFTFQCVGVSVDGVESPPVSGTVTVTTGGRGTR